MIKVGVLALQGSIVEHMDALQHIQNVKAIEVKNTQTLTEIDGLILPGGESTTIGKLLKIFDLLVPLKNMIDKGLPVWGTCAGMILLAKKISNQSESYLNVMDIEVYRNGYGSQLDSFKTKLTMPPICPLPIPLVFIRAPYVKDIWEDVKIIGQIDNRIIACQQKNILATAFHPELTDNLYFHKYFINIIKKNLITSIV